MQQDATNETFRRTPDVTRFLDAIERILPAYKYQAFTFVTLRTETEIVLLGARLHLMLSTPEKPRRVSTPRITAVRGVLPGHATGLRGFLEGCAVNDWIVTNDGAVRPSINSSDGMSAYYANTGLNHITPSAPPFAHRLIIEGYDWSRNGISESDLSRELLGKSYESLHDLFHDFGLSTHNRRATIEILADPVARFEASSLRKRQATIRVRLPLGIPKSEFHLTIKNSDSGTTIRESMGADNLAWSLGEEFIYGTLLRDLPREAVIKCSAIYGDRQDEIELSDPESLPNARRRIIEIADPGLDRHRQLLINPAKEQSRDFEASVASLLFMLGCSPAYVSAISNMKDEPDIYAVTPCGNVLVVECTIKIPDDTKITKLASRAAKLHGSQLAAAGSSPRTIIAVLVVPLPAEELHPTLRRAEEHGIILLNRSNIETAIQMTERGYDADSLLEQLRQSAFFNRFSVGDTTRR